MKNQTLVSYEPETVGNQDGTITRWTTDGKYAAHFSAKHGHRILDVDGVPMDTVYSCLPDVIAAIQKIYDRAEA